MTLFDEIRRDMEAGTPGPWVHNGRTGVKASGSVDTYSGAVWGSIAFAEPTRANDFEGREWTCAGDETANARRIARVPQLEAIALAAGELAKVAGAFDSAISDPKGNAGSARVSMCNALAALRKAMEAAE